MDDPAGTSDAKRPGDAGYATALWWSELKRAEKAFESWMKDADDVVDRFSLADENMKQGARYNVLWSNVKTLAPAIYAKPPKAVATRRYLDKDPIGRIACRIIQRATQYQIDTGEVHEAVKMAVMDRLLGGRGQVWCRYEPTIGEAGEGAGEDPEGSPDQAREASRITAEIVHVDYVHRKDFRHDPARTWDEVTWGARRSYMTRDALVERFGEIGNDVTLNCGPDGGSGERQRGEIEALRKAEVWEIWDRAKGRVCWIAKGLEDPLDERDDPYRLQAFFPFPRPLYSTVTTEKLVPTPDYMQYRAQAEQMDDISDRIDGLIDACRVLGVYDESFPELARLLKQKESTLSPVAAWQQFATTGGMKGAVDFLPIDVFVTVLAELFKVKAEVKSDIYETTGISDILRGQGDPSETATGVQTKGHFATLRLKAEQEEVARFVRDIVRLMAEMTCELFQPLTLAEMASCQEMDELQIDAPPPMMGHNGGPPMGAPPMMAPRQPTMAGPAPGIGV